MSAATELVDKSERNRAQGIVKFVTFPTGAMAVHKTAISYDFDGRSTGLNARFNRISNIPDTVIKILRSATTGNVALA
jgi:hypothetical protein